MAGFLKLRILVLCCGFNGKFLWFQKAHRCMGFFLNLYVFYMTRDLC